MSGKITCFIADDEPLAREGLTRYINRIDYLELKGEFEDALQLDNALHSGQGVDILFLDIEMPLINGIDYLATLHNNPPAVILTTAYEQYALQAYDLNVIDYLLKPISFNRFMQAASKARDYLRRDRTATERQDYTFIRSDKRLHKISYSDIRWIEAIENYIKIVTGDQTVITRMTLKAFSEQLPPHGFIQIHKSLIVNMAHVCTIEGNMLHLSDVTLTASRHFRANLDSYLERFNP